MDTVYEFIHAPKGNGKAFDFVNDLKLTLH